MSATVRLQLQDDTPSVVQHWTQPKELLHICLGYLSAHELASHTATFAQPHPRQPAADTAIFLYALLKYSAYNHTRFCMQFMLI